MWSRGALPPEQNSSFCLAKNRGSPLWQARIKPRFFSSGGNFIPGSVESRGQIPIKKSRVGVQVASPTLQCRMGGWMQSCACALTSPTLHFVQPVSRVASEGAVEDKIPSTSNAKKLSTTGERERTERREEGRG